MADNESIDVNKLKFPTFKDVNVWEQSIVFASPYDSMFGGMGIEIDVESLYKLFKERMEKEGCP